MTHSATRRQRHRPGKVALCALPCLIHITSFFPDVWQWFSRCVHPQHVPVGVGGLNVWLPCVGRAFGSHGSTAHRTPSSCLAHRRVRSSGKATTHASEIIRSERMYQVDRYRMRGCECVCCHARQSLFTTVQSASPVSGASPCLTKLMGMQQLDEATEFSRRARLD